MSEWAGGQRREREGVGVSDNGHSILISLCAVDNSILGRQITCINGLICHSKTGSCFPTVVWPYAHTYRLMGTLLLWRGEPC